MTRATNRRAVLGAVLAAGAEDGIKQAVEARRRMLEARVALATDDGEKDSIARDIDSCKSLLRKLAASEEGRA